MGIASKTGSASKAGSAAKTGLLPFKPLRSLSARIQKDTGEDPGKDLGGESSDKEFLPDVCQLAEKKADADRRTTKPTADLDTDDEAVIETPSKVTAAKTPVKTRKRILYPDRDLLKLTNLSEAVLVHLRLSQAADFFRRAVNIHIDEFNDKEWQHIVTLYYAGVFNVMQEARKNPKVFRLYKKVYSLKWTNDDQAARLYAFIFSMLYSTNPLADRTVTILRGEWQKTGAPDPPLPHMPEDLSGVVCNSYPLRDPVDVAAALRNEPAVPPPVTEKEIEYAIAQRTQSAAQGGKPATRSATRDEPINIQNSESETSDDALVVPDVSSVFLTSPWTWEQVMRVCHKADMSVAILISWYHFNPSDYDLNDLEQDDAPGYSDALRRVDDLLKTVRQKEKAYAKGDLDPPTAAETEARNREIVHKADLQLAQLFRTHEVDDDGVADELLDQHDMTSGNPVAGVEIRLRRYADARLAGAHQRVELVNQSCQYLDALGRSLKSAFKAVDSLSKLTHDYEAIASREKDAAKVFAGDVHGGNREKDRVTDDQGAEAEDHVADNQGAEADPIAKRRKLR